MLNKQLLKILAFFFCSFSFISKSFTQNLQTIADSIEAEGKKLYRLEKASWHGTDVFLEKFPKERENIGGYFSYIDGGLTNCIFFSKSTTPEVLAAISFDSSFDPAKAIIDNNKRKFTEAENDIYTIRKTGLELVNTDTLFKAYNNTNLNFIPLIEHNSRRLFILTGPKNYGVMIIGNDYLIEFNKENQVTVKKQLHRNIIPVEFGNEKSPDKQAVAAFHSHLPETGDFITSTDICTIMLYEKMAKWEQHTVVSEKYFSIWDCEKDQLLIMTREAMEKIMQHQKEMKKKN